jgi:hypothetical protein
MNFIERMKARDATRDEYKKSQSIFDKIAIFGGIVSASVFLYYLYHHTRIGHTKTAMTIYKVKPLSNMQSEFSLGPVKFKTNLNNKVFYNACGTTKAVDMYNWQEFSLNFDENTVYHNLNFYDIDDHPLYRNDVFKCQKAVIPENTLIQTYNEFIIPRRDMVKNFSVVKNAPQHAIVFHCRRFGSNIYARFSALAITGSYLYMKYCQYKADEAQAKYMK